MTNVKEYKKELINLIDIRIDRLLNNLKGLKEDGVLTTETIHRVDFEIDILNNIAYMIVSRGSNKNREVDKFKRGL